MNVTGQTRGGVVAEKYISPRKLHGWCTKRVRHEAKSGELYISRPRRGEARRDGARERELEKTGRENRRGVSFHLILQILPKRSAGLLPVEKQATATAGLRGGGGGGKKGPRGGRRHDNDALVTARSPSPESAVYRVSC